MRRIATTLLLFSFIGAAYVAGGQPSMRLLMGQLGIGVTVPPNPYNTVAEQLTNWQGDLADRERALYEREKMMREASNRLNALLALAVAFIGGLLGLNFYLDRRRQNKP